MFMRICLLLLFLIGNAQSAQIETEYRVLSIKGALGRRADVEVQCDLSHGNSSRNFVLTVKREGNSATLTVSFQGRGITVFQPLKEDQKLKNGRLEKVDPLSGDVLTFQRFSFKDGKINFQDLEPKYIYRLSYRIVASIQNNLRIISPQVSIKKGNLEENKRNEQLLKFVVPVFFSPGSYQLDEKGKYILNGIKDLLKLCKIKVIGYADNSTIVKSKVASNRELAKLRALSVKNYLLK